MDVFRVPGGCGEAELIEKKSRFIGHVWVTETEEEAQARIKEMRDRFWDASHNVYAYIIRQGGAMRYSDDGEPQGTSGQPTLNVFRSEGIFNVTCVVTRYFGGTLLGAGGLVRAYSKTAKLALDAAGISEMRMWTTAVIPVGYPMYERFKREIEQNGGIVENTEYGADIVITASFPSENMDGFYLRITEITAGNTSKDDILLEGEGFRPMPVVPPKTAPVN